MRVNDLEAVRQECLGQADAAAKALREAEATAAEKSRAATHAEAGRTSAQSRVKVLEAQLEQAVAEIAEVQRKVQDAEGERGAAAGAAAKESASLSSALRATRARYAHSQQGCTCVCHGLSVSQHAHGRHEACLQGAVEVQAKGGHVFTSWQAAL